MQNRFFNRDLSWLSFNHRVLQEASNKDVPLYERIKFLAIFSSNLEEFYRIRVAEWKRLARLKKKTKKELQENPPEVLKKINETVQKHQHIFNTIFWGQVAKELEEHNVFIVNEKMLDDGQAAFVNDFFREKVMPLIKPVWITTSKNPPRLDDKSIYMAIKLRDPKETVPNKFEYAITEIPSRKISRFLVLPKKGKKNFVIILGDVLRLGIRELFPAHEVVEAYSIKLTLDAELQLEDEFSGNLLKKVKRGLSERQKGRPTRLVYDVSMSKDFLKHLMKVFGINRLDLMPGGRYHNFSDLISFPDFKLTGVHYPPLPALKVRQLDESPSMLAAIRERDFMLHYPYHSFDYVIRLLNEAAEDKLVTAIKITLYRVASHSRIIQALVKARENGKQVTVFVELKARFDEESNIYYANELEEADVKVLYSFPVLKVHAKMICIERREEERIRRYSYLSTGNFNESTSRIYGDSSLMTRDKYIGREVSAVFDILGDTRIKKEFRLLLFAPDHMRHDLYTLIDQEIKNALKGKPASIFLKLNSLQDHEIIKKLYEASQEGVEIKIIVRSICCLKPGIKGLSENIKVISIVDRFLEHSRVFIFGKGAEAKIYLSSADLMERNLSRRFEVAFPILSSAMREEIVELMRIQWKDNTKARIINKIQNNTFRKSVAKERSRAQMDEYEYLKNNG